MMLSEFQSYIPENADIRPVMAEATRNYILFKIKGEPYPSKQAHFLNKVIEKTQCPADKFGASGKTDPATNKINGWKHKDPGQRGDPTLTHAVLYWFFRYETDPSYFVQVAKKIWKKDSELLRRFCYAKQGGLPNDPFDTILDRFRSDRALTYKVILIEQEQQLSATYAAAIELGPSYQAGREEFQLAKQILLSKRSKSVALTAAVHGAGGYGKSSISQELCNDNRIRDEFSGGIYWLQFGLLDNSNESIGVVGLAEAIDRMLAAQYPISERPTLVWNNRDSDILKLVDVLPSSRLLLIADDLWVAKQSSWLSEVPLHVSVLMTTRRQSVAKHAAHEITIRHLTHEASYTLLTHGMTNISSDQQKRFRKLAKGFRGWPLLLGLANGVFKQMNGDLEARIDKSLSEYEQFLVDDQIDAWDVEEAGDEAVTKRRKLVGLCIEAGLRAIPSSNDPELLRKLAIFPDGTNIPFSVAINYWAEIKNTDISKSRGTTLLRLFADFSFFASFNEDSQSLRLHDEILGYFRTRTSKDQRRSLHYELLKSLKAHCCGGWETLPQDHTYGWTQLLYHLERAGQSEEADDLRTDFYWIKAKIASVGASELLRSFRGGCGRSDTRLVGRAIGLSITELTARPNSLAHQLFGRLSHYSNSRLENLSRFAQSDPSCWPQPVNPHLSPIGPELLRFQGHSDTIASVAFDARGEKILTTSDDWTARLWNAETGAQIGKSIEGHDSDVNSAAFDPSGSRVVTASDDGVVRLWDAETGMQIGNPIEGHSACVNSAAFDPSGNRIVTASEDKTARLWNAETGAQIGKPLVGHDRPIIAAAFNPSGSKIVTLSLDETARLWNAETSLQIGNPIGGRNAPVLTAAFDPSGSRIVTTSWDETARLWDVETGVQIDKLLEGHDERVNSAAFDPSGSRIVTASDDGTARLWDAETGAQIGPPLEGHMDCVNSAVFDPSGSKIVTASDDGTARLWDAATGLEIGRLLEGHGDRRLEGHVVRVNSAAFDPSGSRIVTASDDGIARLWDAEMAAQSGRPLEGHDFRVNSVGFNPSGNRIVTASDDKTVRLWDVSTGAQIGKPLEGHGWYVTCAAFDPSGSRIVTASWDGTARLWDAETGSQIGKPLEGHRGIVMSADFDPSGSRIVTASHDKTARLWDAETGAQIGEPLEGHSGPVISADFDPSGSRIVTASHDKTARLWDAETGAQIGKPLEGHDEPVNRAVFDPRGNRVVTASDDGTARLWDAETGAQIGKPLEGHGKPIIGIDFDSSGSKVVTASVDRTARLWNVETGACLAVIDFDSPSYCVSWHKEHLAIGLNSGLLCIFLAIKET